MRPARGLRTNIRSVAVRGMGREGDGRAATRNVLLDALRGVAMCLVVAGHTQMDASIKTPIYAFHMPLFFLVSGVTFNYARYRSDLPAFGARRFRRLVLPYLVSAPAFYLIWLLVGRHYGEQAVLHVPPLHPLLGILYASGDHHWLVFNVVLWYLPALWVTELAFWGAHRASDGGGWIRLSLVAAAAGGLGWALGRAVHLPWSADVALVAVPLLLVGEWLRRRRWFEDGAVGPRVLVLLTAVAALAVVVRLNGRVDMMGREFGSLPLFYLGGVAGTLALAELVRAGLRWRAFAGAAAHLGRESLPILVFHLLGIRVLSAVIAVAVPAQAEALRRELWWLYVPFAIAFSLAAAAAIRRVPPLARVFYPDLDRLTAAAAPSPARSAAPFPPREEPSTSS